MSETKNERNGFPVYQDHTSAKCFKCGGPLSEHRKSGYPPSYGEWEGLCPKCDIATWYNLADEE